MDSKLNSNIQTKVKRVGTREEVFKGLAIYTAGGLQKDDIIEKKIGNRVLYISKKLSEKMKENITIIKTNNPNFFKRMQKKTVSIKDKPSIINENSNSINPIQQQIQQNQLQQNPSNQLQNQALEKKKKQHSKTQKLSFKVRENEVRTIFYPELKGMDIKELKEELLREEAEEDRGIKLPPKKSNTEFKIEDMPDIDLNSL